MVSREDRALLPIAEIGNLHNTYDLTTHGIKLIYRPADLMFDPDPLPDRSNTTALRRRGHQGRRGLGIARSPARLRATASATSTAAANTARRPRGPGPPWRPDRPLR
jgi:hypothetical protein